MGEMYGFVALWLLIVTPDTTGAAWAGSMVAPFATKEACDAAKVELQKQTSRRLNCVATGVRP